MGLGMRMYATDYGYHVCEQQDVAFLDTSTRLIALWWQQLLPYVSSNLDTFYCSANLATFRITNSAPRVSSNNPKFGQEGYSYGFNSIGTGFTEQFPRSLFALGFGSSGIGPGGTVPNNRRDSEIVSPSDFIAIGDSQSDFLEDYLITTWFPGGGNAKKHAWPGNRHRRGANIVFVDGHVENNTQRGWLSKTPAARRRWNFDNEPHPETWTDTLTPP
jgi:prepilin-type processing-associated H-X9-DG protein